MDIDSTPSTATAGGLLSSVTGAVTGVFSAVGDIVGAGVEEVEKVAKAGEDIVMDSVGGDGRGGSMTGIKDGVVGKVKETISAVAGGKGDEKEKEKMKEKEPQELLPEQDVYLRLLVVLGLMDVGKLEEVSGSEAWSGLHGGLKKNNTSGRVW